MYNRGFLQTPANRDEGHSLVVVPAKAGTHNHRVQLLEKGVSYTALSRDHAVWAPAFAGATVESSDPHTIISFSSLPECSGTINVTPIAIAIISTGMQRNDSANDPVCCCSAMVTKGNSTKPTK